MDLCRPSPRFQLWMRVRSARCIAQPVRAFSRLAFSFFFTPAPWTRHRGGPLPTFSFLFGSLCGRLPLSCYLTQVLSSLKASHAQSVSFSCLLSGSVPHIDFFIPPISVVSMLVVAFFGGCFSLFSRGFQRNFFWIRALEFLIKLGDFRHPGFSRGVIEATAAPSPAGACSDHR